MGKDQIITDGSVDISKVFSEKELIAEFKKLPPQEQQMIIRLNKDVDAMLTRYTAGYLRPEQLTVAGVLVIKVIERISLVKQLIGPARGPNRP
jgi:hypothetical protein